MKTINTLLYTLLTALFMLTATNANAQQSWSFTSISSTDKTNLAADTENWTYDSAKDRYGNVNALTGEALIANGTELAYTNGLKFTCEDKDIVRVDIGGSRLAFNGTATITIPGLTQGQVVTVKAVSSSKDAENRTINASNLSGTTGFGEATLYPEKFVLSSVPICTGTVAADGDVTITSTGGYYIYSISVTSDGGGEVTPPTTNYNDVPLNTAENQMRLTLGSEIKYYNTDDVNVTFDRAAGTVTVTPIAGTWQDVYTKTVNNISFTLASDDTPSGDVTEGEVKIKTYDGWNEAAYIEWELLDGASSYAVYVKGGSVGSEYKKIDYQLVRKYSDYGRADILGLPAGSYSIKVVPVINDAEDEGKASVVDGIEVIGHDRVGFAFSNGKAPGAYNNDGTLKSGAIVVYVTEENKNTVTSDAIGSGYVGLQGILEGVRVGIKDGNLTKPVDIRLIGQITNPSELDKGDLLIDMASESKSASYTGLTIEGIGNDAVADGWGIRLKSATSVEIRNLAFMNCHSSEGDNIGLQQDNDYIWVHHCDMFYGDAGSDADQIKGDGALDCKKSDHVTFSYNHFWDSGKCCLLSNGDNEYDCYITYHHNWFDHSDSRHPRIRCYNAHIYNNYFDGCAKYGVGATTGCSAFVENNYFRNTNKPMMISMQGTDIANGEGTFSSEAGGIIKSYGNAFAEKSSNFRYITYAEDNVEFDAYEATSRDEKVPSEVKTKKGSTGYNNFDTDASIMYDYTPDAASEVVSVVTGKYGAGRLQHGDFQWSFDNSKEDTNYDVIPELKSAVSNYKTTLIGIFDGENDQSGEGGDEGGTTEPGGGDEGGETGDGGDTPVIEGTVTCSFEGNTPSSNLFTISGNYSDSKGTMTINSTTYTYCLKMETATSITFTIDKPMTLNLYLDGKCTAKVDGEKYTGSNGVITVQLVAGSHEITKADSCNLFLIELVPVE